MRDRPTPLEGALPPPNPEDGPSSATAFSGRSGRDAAPYWRQIALYVPSLALVAGVLLWPLRDIGLTGDDWEILLRAYRSWWAAATEPLVYHYIPVATVTLKGLTGLIRTNAHAWALVNGSLLVLAAFAVLRFSVRLFGDAWSGFLAACLLVGSAAFHEVTFWPAVGSIFALAGILYLLALGIGFRLADDVVPVRRSVAFAVVGGAAYFTYPGTITLFPVVVLWTAHALLRGGVGTASGFSTRMRELVARFAPCIPVVLCIALARSHFSKELAQATQLGFSFERLKYLAEGIAATFSLQGSRAVLHSIVTLGLTADGGSGVARVTTALFVGSAVVLSAFLLLRRSRSGESYLALALLVHFAVMAPWVSIAPRHRFFPSMVALPLLVRMLGHVGRRLARWWTSDRDAHGAAFAALVAVALLLASRGSFLAAARLWSRSARVNGQLLALVVEARASRPRLTTIVTVDVPAYLSADGFTVPFTSYNLPKFLSLRAPGLELERFRLIPERQDQAWGPRILPITLRRVQELVLDDTRLVVRYDLRADALRRLDADDFVPASALTSERAPELEWRDGPRPWLQLSPGETFEARIAVPADGWMALRYLSAPSTTLLLTLDDRQQLHVGPRPGRPASWAVLAVPPPPAADHAVPATRSVRIEPGEPLAFGGLWSFGPMARYTREASPFLGWLGSGEEAFFEVGEEILLPLLAANGGASGRADLHLRVAVSAETIGSAEIAGRVLPIRGSGSRAAEWVTLRQVVEGAGVQILRLRNAGSAPLRIGTVELKAIPL